jgi:hypothetical protein
VNITLIDGRMSPHWLPFRYVAHRYVRGTFPTKDGDPVQQALDALREIRRHIDAVNEELATLSIAECPQGKLTEKLYRINAKLRVWMLVMEEFQVYFELADQKINKEFAQLLAEIQALGPAAGVIVNVPLTCGAAPSAPRAPIGKDADPMGVKLGGGLLKCGTCGKPRGITHTCVTRATSRRRKTRTRLRPRITVTCTTCGKPRGIRHSCHPKSDFKARRRKQATAERQRKRKAVRARQAAKRKATRERQAARRRQAAAERRAREKARKAAAKQRRPRSSRPRGDSHEPGTCGDHDCPRYGCKAYWAGMADCPGPHGPEGG